MMRSPWPSSAPLACRRRRSPQGCRRSIRGTAGLCGRFIIQGQQPRALRRSLWRSGAELTPCGAAGEAVASYLYMEGRLLS
mmetsp:Transcript_87600/g.220407  ORF Transcript_87600/g.220407 Transcript_87600/m.220407 type:complete len:81 (+) Transcript_87600:1498-1740(+)